MSITIPNLPITPDNLSRGASEYYEGIFDTTSSTLAKSDSIDGEALRMSFARLATMMQFMEESGVTQRDTMTLLWLLASRSHQIVDLMKKIVGSKGPHGDSHSSMTTRAVAGDAVDEESYGSCPIHSPMMQAAHNVGNALHSRFDPVSEKEIDANAIGIVVVDMGETSREEDRDGTKFTAELRCIGVVLSDTDSDAPDNVYRSAREFVGILHDGIEGEIDKEAEKKFGGQVSRLLDKIRTQGKDKS